MGDTEISWTHKPGTRGRTWNPVQGCQRISPGCQHCYAERLAARFAETGWSKGLINLRTRKWNGQSRLAAHKLTEPLSWRQPSTVFVNSMSDLFYEGFSNEQIAAAYGVMALCPHHTFQILTKRATRMREWFEWMGAKRPRDSEYDWRASICWDHAKRYIRETGAPIDSGVWDSEFTKIAHTMTWPLPNVWQGVSVENQEAAAERIPELLRTPAAVRFLSCEPLLGPLILHEDGLDWLTSDHCRGVDWVIAGCESGPGARPCSVEWLRSLRDQCESAGVPFFLKQAEESVDLGVDGLLDIGDDDSIAFGDGSKLKQRGPGGCRIVERPYLDGEQHAAFPGAK